MKASTLLLISALMFATRAQSQSITIETATHLSLPPFHVPEVKLTPAQNATVISNSLVELERWQQTNAVLLRQIESSATNKLSAEVVNARGVWSIGEHRKQTYGHFLNHLRLQIKYESSVRPANP